ncbi:MAG: hypothetical protein FWE84_04365 [Firmicutes bacterium]|nr:hypothetical protein [Bacillota bacterium]
MQENKANKNKIIVLLFLVPLFVLLAYQAIFLTSVIFSYEQNHWYNVFIGYGSMSLIFAIIVLIPLAVGVLFYLLASNNKIGMLGFKIIFLSISIPAICLAVLFSLINAGITAKPPIASTFSILGDMLVLLSYVAILVIFMLKRQQKKQECVCN